MVNVGGCVFFLSLCGVWLFFVYFFLVAAWVDAFAVVCVWVTTVYLLLVMTFSCFQFVNCIVLCPFYLVPCETLGTLLG